MLKKLYRLDKKEFTTAFQKGRSFNLPHFVLKYKASPYPYARLGVSCGLRVSKKATIRNRMKRRIMEAFRQRADAFLRGDYIIIVKPGTEKEPFATMKDELIQSLISLNEKNNNIAH